MSGNTSAAAGIFLRGLKRLGVGFVHGGTDFAAIIEAHLRHLPDARCRLLALSRLSYPLRDASAFRRFTDIRMGSADH